MQITEEQVKEWMAARFAECREITPRGAMSFEAKVDNFHPGRTRIRFHAYQEKIGNGDETESAADAIESFRIKAGAYTPAEKAAQLRNQAAQLVTEADALEAATL